LSFVSHRLGRFLSLPIAACVAAALAPGCSLGEGSGSVSGVLDVPLCWSGDFDLKPDFFAAVPSSSGALQIRIQNGGDFETFSDGVAIQVDDVGKVRGDPLPDGTQRPNLLKTALSVGLSPAVTPPGVPVKAVANPPIVHATLSLQRSCRTQNVALHAMSAVSLNPDGSCARPDGGDPPLSCGAAAGMDGGATPDASTSVGGASPADGAAPTSTMGSTIVFDNLFDGNPDESNAKQRLTEATFELFLADPREICPGGLGPPPRCRGHLTGHFKFYFQRGRPAQPFP
jgi:hypothetical protein